MLNYVNINLFVGGAFSFQIYSILVGSEGVIGTYVSNTSYIKVREKVRIDACLEPLYFQEGNNKDF